MCSLFTQSKLVKFVQLSFYSMCLGSEKLASSFLILMKKEAQLEVY